MNGKSDLRRLGLFDARVPRFTSYPPANRFVPQINGEVVSRWLSDTPDGADISLYVHIPFCRRLCWFCACRTQGTKTDAPLGRYVETVLAEAAQIREQLPANINVKRLHLGGGTPTILPVELSTKLLSDLNSIFGFEDMAEFSVEIDPTEIDNARLDTLRSFGMDRASLGVQDFDPAVQQAIGREQSEAVTRDTIEALRVRGIDQINIDFLYGLPHQNSDSLARTLDSVIDLRPTRLALYGYAHVPWMSKRQGVIPADALPGAEERFDLSEQARMHLLSNGYTQIGIDHFALPGDRLAIAASERRLSRSFQGYTDDDVPRLIGLGASAISRYPEGYAQNQPATLLYQGLIAEGRAPTYRGFELSDEDRVRAEIIEQLMCYHMVRLSDIKHRVEATPEWLSQLAWMHPDAIRFDGESLTLEPWARPLARIFAAQLGETHTEQEAFSAAI